MKARQTLGLSLVLTLGVLVVVGVVFVAVRNPWQASNAPAQSFNGSIFSDLQTGSTATFTEIRVSSLVSSVPENNALLATTPNTVSVIVKEVLAPNSSITITDSEGQPAHLGKPTFSNDRLTMTTLLRRGVTGPLTVTYQSCSIDNACETGRFGFVIQKTQ